MQWGSCRRLQRQTLLVVWTGQLACRHGCCCCCCCTKTSSSLSLSSRCRFLLARISQKHLHISKPSSRSLLVDEQSYTWPLLRGNDRKSRHRRIKKQRRYERLAATSQFLSTMRTLFLWEFPP